MLCLVILTVYFSSVCLCNTPPEVEIPLGKIRGSWRETHNGRIYAAYEGIPYAKPPIGNLRFEAPEPVEPWIGTWDATNTYICLQKSLNGPKITGQEDCLYLNVYVHKENSDTQNGDDVLVSIHGGGFMIGSGHFMINADVNMEKNIILVTINYRLGLHGFLSTEDNTIPGNNGMKDQVLALKWIKDNIAYFGGNSNSITIVGESAGGASVHLHYFSPLSQGLFNRGISQSGTALNPWAIKENPLENAKKLASLVGCPDSSTQELKNCLQSRPGVLLIEKIHNFYGFDNMPCSPFAPVIEKHSGKPFLTKEPYILLKEKKVLDVPWITSTTRDEGLFLTFILQTPLEELGKDWTKASQYLLDFNDNVPISKRSDLAEKVKQFYLGSEDISMNNIMKLVQIFTDRYFVVDGETAAKLQSKATNSPVYYFFFNYEGENSMVKLFTSKETNITGVCHGDDMFYFYGALIDKFSEADEKMKNICQDMLFSYATTGKPSFGTSEWIPTKDSELTYMNVTSPDDIILHTVENLAPLAFWKSLGIMENENLITKDELKQIP